MIAWIIIGAQAACNVIAVVLLLLNKRDAKRAAERERTTKEARLFMIPRFEHGAVPEHRYDADSDRVWDCSHVPVYSIEFERLPLGYSWKWACTKCGTLGHSYSRYMPSPVSAHGATYLEVLARLGHTTAIRSAARKKLLYQHPGHPIQRDPP